MLESNHLNGAASHFCDFKCRYDLPTSALLALVGRVRMWGARPTGVAPLVPRVVAQVAALQSHSLALAILSATAGCLLGWCTNHAGPWSLSLLALGAWQVSVLGGCRHSLFVGGLTMALAPIFWLSAGMFWVSDFVPDGMHASRWQAVSVAFAVCASLACLLPLWFLLVLGARRIQPNRRLNAGTVAGIWVLSQWAAMELARTTGLIGNYATLSLAWVDTPFARAWLPLVGVQGFEMLLVALASLLGLMVWRKLHEPELASRRSALTALTLALLLVFMPSADWTSPVGEPLAVYALQPSTSRQQEWTVAVRDQRLDQLLHATAFAEPGAIALSSETFFVEPPPNEGYGRWKEATQLASDRQVHLVIGLPYGLRDNAGLHLMNAVVQISPQQESVYAKQKLAPIGEYLPGAKWLGPLYEWLTDAKTADVAIGPPGLAEPLFIGEHFVGASICHELAFSDLIRQGAKVSGWMVNLANDAWAKNDSSYHKQVRSIARLRAMENGKTVVRVSEGGKSVSIDSAGRVIEEAGSFGETTLKLQIQPRSGYTPFNIISNYLPVLGIGILFLCLAWTTNHIEIPRTRGEY